MRPSSSSGKGSVRYDGSTPATIGKMLRGTATVTSPAPPRSAPNPLRHAAPLIPGCPAMMSAFPKVPLCASLGRGGAFGKDLIRLIAAGRFIAAPKEPQRGIEQTRLNPSCGLPVPGGRSGRRCRLP